MVKEKEDYVLWEKRYRGLCNSSEYYVGTPAQRDVEIKKEVVTYQIEPEKVKVVIFWEWTADPCVPSLRTNSGAYTFCIPAISSCQ